jgi:hypothetical protein
VIALSARMRLSNSERLHLAMQALHDHTPRSAREKLGTAIRILEGAELRTTTSRAEQGDYQHCHTGALKLRQLLRTPPQRPPWAQTS